MKVISDCKVVVGESVARKHRMVVCRMTSSKKDEEDIDRAEDEVVETKKEEFCVVFREELRQALVGQKLLQITGQRQLISSERQHRQYLVCHLIEKQTRRLGDGMMVEGCTEKGSLRRSGTLEELKKVDRRCR